MGLIASLKAWADLEILTATDLNANFAEVRNTVNAWGAFKDQAQTFTQPQTFAAALTAQQGATIQNGVTVSGGATIAGGLTVSAGGAAVTGSSAITGDLAVSGTITGGSIVVPAASVTPGAFAAGAYTFPAGLTASALVVDGGPLRARRLTQTGAGGTVDFATANHIRHTMTGNGTLTLTGGVAGTVTTLEVLQDLVGGRTVTFANATWTNGIAPPTTTIASRKDVYTVFFDGSAYLVQQWGANFASTA